MEQSTAGRKSHLGPRWSKKVHVSCWRRLKATWPSYCPVWNRFAQGSLTVRASLRLVPGLGGAPPGIWVPSPASPVGALPNCWRTREGSSRGQDVLVRLFPHSTFIKPLLCTRRVRARHRAGTKKKRASPQLLKSGGSGEVHRLITGARLVRTG